VIHPMQYELESAYSCPMPAALQRGSASRNEAEQQILACKTTTSAFLQRGCSGVLLLSSGQTPAADDAVYE